MRFDPCDLPIGWHAGVGWYCTFTTARAKRPFLPHCRHSFSALIGQKPVYRYRWVALETTA